MGARLLDGGKGSDKMRYVKVRWVHAFQGEPVVLYSELTDDMWEVRKVEVYADGRADLADSERESGNTRLGTEPYAELVEIAADPQFEPAIISIDEFETVWKQAIARYTAAPKRR